MKSILFILVLGLVVAKDRRLEDRRPEFNEAMRKYAQADGLLQSEPPAVAKARYNAYCDDADTVDAINEDANLPYEAETNFLSILLPEERASYTGFNVSAVVDNDDDSEPAPQWVGADGVLPEQRDFRQNTAPGVKNQGGCGSCWTFAAASALEGEMYFVTGKIQNLAEQEYLDCGSDYGGSTHDGCNGGWMEWCYKYNMASSRMGSTADTRYGGSDNGECSKYKVKNNVFTSAEAKVTGNMKVQGDTNLLKAAASHVVSVAFHVNGNFQVYRSGVYVDDTCNTHANHAVTVIGYGKLNDRKYWLVRNSWGSGWGDKGYVKMDREKNNMCYISQYSHYPKVGCTGTCVEVTPDDADTSGGEGGDDDDDDDDEDDDDEEKQCGWGPKLKGKYLSGTKLIKCVKGLSKAKAACEKNKTKCSGLNFNKKKKCYDCISATETETKKTKKKNFSLQYTCEASDECPSGTIRCDKGEHNGMCVHEHMCKD